MEECMEQRSPHLLLSLQLIPREALGIPVAQGFCAQAPLPFLITVPVCRPQQGLMKISSQGHLCTLSLSNQLQEEGQSPALEKGSLR